MKIFNCKNCGKEKVWNRNSYNIFCGNVCQGLFKRKETIERFTLGEVKESDTIRKVLAETRGYHCTECGIDSHNGKPITLHVDHIDGNCLNNMPDNVRLLCPNCHSQSPNWGARNKGFGRQSRGLKR